MCLCVRVRAYVCMYARLCVCGGGGGGLARMFIRSRACASNARAYCACVRVSAWESVCVLSPTGPDTPACFQPCAARSRTGPTSDATTS